MCQCGSVLRRHALLSQGTSVPARSPGSAAGCVSGQRAGRFSAAPTVCIVHAHAAIRHPRAVLCNASVPVASSVTRLPFRVKVSVIGSTEYARSPEMMSCRSPCHLIQRCVTCPSWLVGISALAAMRHDGRLRAGFSLHRSRRRQSHESQRRHGVITPILLAPGEA